MSKNLIVGAGFSGAVLAFLIAEKLNEHVIVIDRRAHIAGNSFDYRDNNNIMIHKYGPHIFHTESEKVWNFLKPFCDFNQYMHKGYAIVDGIGISLPFNINTLYKIFPKTLALRLEEKLLDKFKYNTKVPISEFKNQDDKDLNFLANYIYEKIFLYYTIKQWGVTPEELDNSVTARVPVLIGRDDRYFQDKYQGIPLEGYTKLIENMLNHPNIEVILNTDFSQIKESFDKIFYTGSVDEYFNYEFGQLPYRSVYFKFEEKNCEYYQPNSIVNYPCNYDYTRINEYKHFLNDKSDKTVIAKEYSEFFEAGKNERFYPIPNTNNRNLYNKYLEKAQSINNVYFLGRLGDYVYQNMDKAILRAINLFEDIYHQ